MEAIKSSTIHRCRREGVERFPPLKNRFSHNLYVTPETVGHPSLQEEQPQQGGAMSVRVYEL